MTDKLQRIRQSFVEADEDGDSLLNRVEFNKYVLAAYGKPSPPQMYDQLCSHFNKDLELGIDWVTAKSVWKQAQQKKGSTPEPQPKPRNEPPPAIRELKQIFLNADKDKDGLLLQSEFIEFAKHGFKKNSIPNQMYFSVCEMFHKNAQVGIDWESALNLWKKSNPNWDKNTNAKPTTEKVSISSTASKLSASKSYSERSLAQDPQAQTQTKILTAENLRRHTSQTERSLAGDHPSENGSESEISVSRRSRASRASRRHRSVASGLVNGDHHRKGNWDETDASQMVVHMMENKLKNVQSLLKNERQKRKKVEELAQTVLVANEQYKQTVAELQLQTEKLNAQSASIKNSMRRLKSQLEDDRETIQHLTAQRNTMKEERDQSFELLTRMESEHIAKTRRSKQKHKEQMEQLSRGFLQSLGADPGKDVHTVIKELKNNNQTLHDQVDMLALQLARKKQSLLEALNAVNEVAMVTENQEMQARLRLQQAGGVSKLQQVGRKISKKIKRNSNENWHA